MADKFIQLVDTQGNAFAVRVDELGDGSFATVSVSLWQVQNLNELWFIGAGTVAWHA